MYKIAKNLVVYFGGVFLILGMVKWVNFHLVKNITASEPKGFYWLTNGAIKRNSLCLIKIQGKYLKIIKNFGFKDSDTLLKTVVGVSNDTIDINQFGVTINGIRKAHSQAIQSVRNIALYPLPIGFHYKLKPNEYFVMGISADSFDSRYFGVVRKENIVNTVVKVF